jgi:hypothetical protein
LGPGLGRQFCRFGCTFAPDCGRVEECSTRVFAATTDVVVILEVKLRNQCGWPILCHFLTKGGVSFVVANDRSPQLSSSPPEAKDGRFAIPHPSQSARRMGHPALGDAVGRQMLRSLHYAVANCATAPVEMTRLGWQSAPPPVEMTGGWTGWGDRRLAVR